MTINIVCSVLNIILDAILIVWLKQGLWAAALASSLSMSAVAGTFSAIAAVIIVKKVHIQ